MTDAAIHLSLSEGEPVHIGVFEAGRVKQARRAGTPRTAASRSTEATAAAQSATACTARTACTSRGSPDTSSSAIGLTGVAPVRAATHPDRHDGSDDREHSKIGNSSTHGVRELSSNSHRESSLKA